jgi:hypothetical protein
MRGSAQPLAAQFAVRAGSALICTAEAVKFMGSKRQARRRMA